MDLKQSFLPVILGTDLTTYTIARAFHEEYGVISKVFGSATLLMTKHSKIVDITEVANFTDDEVMVKTLVDFAKQTPDKTLILFAASENYVFRILKNHVDLAQFYFIPYAEPEFGVWVSDKMNFYQLCEEHGLAYPKAVKVWPQDDSGIESDFTYPVVLKPSESAEYFMLSFRGKEKAYIANNERELRRYLKYVRRSGYKHPMLLQEYVAGPMSNEYVLNVYSDRDAKVRMMSLGRIILSDPLPEMRGNYVAITNAPRTAQVSALYEQYRNFLEAIEFRGLSNFDFKIDERDGEFKCFEMNLRQGRASFCSVMAGANYTKAIVEDLYGRPADQPEVVYGDKPFVWLNCSEETFYNLLRRENSDLYESVQDIDNIGDALTYAVDMAPERAKLLDSYFKKYDRLIEK